MPQIHRQLHPRYCFWRIFKAPPSYTPVFVLNAVALLLSLLVTSVTMAGPAVSSQMMDKGGLFLPGDEAGMVVPAPLLHTEIEASVSGPIVRYRMRHTFINESDEWTEAIYTYPLPRDSAVDSLEMTVGKRKIIGKITKK